MVTISPEGIITDVNEATVTVLGVPRDQLIETPIHLLDKTARPLEVLVHQ